MRTTIKPDFSVPGNDALSGKLNQLFKEVNKRDLFHHDLSLLTEKKLLIMDEILNALLHELKAVGLGIKETNNESP